MPGQRYRKTVILAGIASLIMFGFSFAIVPFYSAICKATGINTAIPTALEKVSLGKKGMDLKRTITVQFIAINNKKLPWDFYPKTEIISVHPGVNTKVYFYAKNNTQQMMTVQAIPSMTPVNAIEHFHKMECFCFNQQSLQAGESKDMALMFQVDKDLPKEVHTITLAYTLFDITPKNQKN